MLKVNEIFKTIQGETDYAGLPCVLIRLSGCNLRCVYCDTTFAYEEGFELTEEEIVKRTVAYTCDLVMVTGGEPLLQKPIHKLISLLCDKNITVLLETNGTLNLEEVDKRAAIIMDVKTPSSKMSDYMYWKNLYQLRKKDQVKFVLGGKKDYRWAKNIIAEYTLLKRTQVLFSPVFEKLAPDVLSEWILTDKLQVRLDLQIHKYIWRKGEQEGIKPRYSVRRGN